MKRYSKQYFNLIREFSFSWFKLRDQRAVLGLLWSFLNPLIMTSILYFLFKTRLNLDKDKSYFFYILLGSVAWNFFIISIEEGIGALVGRDRMVRNVVFPKEILILSQVGMHIIQHLFEISVVLVLILLFGSGLSVHILLFPVVLIIKSLFISGIALFLGCLCTFARDMVHIWSVISRMAFFLVPVFYKTSSLSLQFRWLVIINPMTQYINFYRDIILNHRTPDWRAFLLIVVVSLLVFIGGLKFFRHYEFKIVEKI